MWKVVSGSFGSAPRRLAPVVAGATLGLSSVVGCVTTHNIAPDQLPAALAGAPGQDQRRLVMGEDGKPVELPSPAHLRSVDVALGGDVQAFEPPVTAKLAGDNLRVEGKGTARSFPLSGVTRVHVKHDDHKADTIGGVILLSFGVSALVAAAAVVVWDASRSCDGEEWCMQGLASALIGIPAATVGVGLTIPGVYLTARGATGLGTPPKKELAGKPAIPEISVGPGSAVVTVPF